MNPILYNADGSKSSAKPLMNMLNQKSKIRENMGNTCSSLQLNGAINATDFNMVDASGNIIMSFSKLMNQYNSGSGSISGGDAVVNVDNGSTLKKSGEACLNDNDCDSNKTCGRSFGRTTAPFQCCKYDSLLYNTKYYCDHLDIGEKCYSNKMCASGYCTNGPGIESEGICTSEKPFDGYSDLGEKLNTFKIMFNSYVSAPEITKNNIKNSIPTSSGLTDRHDIQYFNDYAAKAFIANRIIN